MDALQAELKTAEANLKALEGADSENTSLRGEVDRLKTELAVQQTQLKVQAA